MTTQNAKAKTATVNGNTVNRFQRVKPEEVEFLDERVKDNTFLSKVKKRMIIMCA